MRLRILGLKIGLFTTLAVFLLAVFCSCGKEYSDDFVEANYVIDTFDDSDIFTRNTTLRVTFIEPTEATEGFISSCDKEIYFIFTNMNAAVGDVQFNHIKYKQSAFDVYTNGYRSNYFCLISYDWSKGFNVYETKISFIIAD